VLPLGSRKPLRLTLLGVLPKHSSRSATEGYLEKAREEAQGLSVDVRVETCQDDPASAIVAHAISERTDLIAMATHGRSGLKRLLMGSVTERVLRHSPVPLLACRPGSRMEGWTHVVGLDGSPRAETILDHLIPLTKLMGATLHLVHIEPVIPLVGGVDIESYLERMSAYLTSRGILVRTAVRCGSPGAGIVDYAEEVAAGLVAMTTHGRTGLSRALMGSVAEEVLRKGSCPILLRRDLRRPSLLRPKVRRDRPTVGSDLI
jgi:nucleotide-binding universal stress UspA family protein